MASFSCSGLFGKIGADANIDSEEALKEYKEIMDSYEDGYGVISYKGGAKQAARTLTYAEMKSGNFSTIDLSNWVRSVEDNQQLVSINGGGLTPIFDVIREKNLAKKVKDFFITGKNYKVDNTKIKYELYNDSGTISLVMYTQYGDTILLDKHYPYDLPGFAWWIQHGPGASAIPFDLPLNMETKFGAPPSVGVIDLSEYLSANNRSRIKVEFCKIKNNRYKDDFTYLIIHNKEKGKKVALSFQDERGFSGEYKFEEPDNIRYIRNLNYVDIYGI